MYLPTENNISGQANKILPSVSPIYGFNPFIGQHCAEDILREKGNGRNKDRK
jgi:hypothetical protein